MIALQSCLQEKSLQQLKKGSIVQVSIDRLLIYLDEELIDIVRERTNRVQNSVEK